MTRIVLDKYISENKAAFTKIRLRMERGRRPMRRKRADVEKAIILRLDKARWEKWLEKGMIEVLDHRKYRIRLSCDALYKVKER